MQRGRVREMAPVEADRQICAWNQSRSAFTAVLQPISLTNALALAVAFSSIAFLRFGSTFRFWALLPLLIALAMAVVVDVRTKIIPDLITLPGIGYAIATGTFLESGPPLWPAVSGAIVSTIIVLLVAVISRGAVGGGDIKLAGMLGAALGWQQTLAVLAFSQLTAGFIALGLLITGRRGRRDRFPIGAIISIFGALMLLGRS